MTKKTYITTGGPHEGKKVILHEGFGMVTFYQREKNKLICSLYGLVKGKLIFVRTTEERMKG